MMTDLGAGHPDLWSGVDVYPAVGLPADGAPHRVRNADDQGPPRLAVPARQ